MQEYERGYNNALEFIKDALLSIRYDKIPEGVSREFFDRMGLTLVKLYEINSGYPHRYRKFFTDEEFQFFLRWLKNGDEFDGRFEYDNMKDKKIFYDEFFDPRKLIKEGWVPELEYFDRPQRQAYLAAMDGKIPEDTWKYFHSGVTPEEFLRKRRVWVRADTQYESKYRAFAMMFSYPELLWSSKHPKTDMKMFQVKNYLVGDIENNILLVGSKKYRIYGLDSNCENLDGVAFPVSRYAESIDTGLYHTTKGNFCGTFYYIEPESTIYLISNKVIFSRTKTSAAQLIAKPQTKFAVWEKQERTSIRKPHYQKLYDEGKLRPGLLYTPIQAHTELKYQGYRDPYTVTQHPVYMGAMSLREYDIDNPGLYGVEDEYDQPLCIEMKRQGIEIACLTEMIGAFGIVSELLDARERKKSFSNLVYTT